MSREQSPSERLEQLQLENEQLIEALHSAEISGSVYADLFDLAPVAYLVVDRVGAIERLNEPAAELLASPQERPHLLGRRLRGLVHPDDQGLLAEHLERCAGVARDVGVERDVGGAGVVGSELRARDGTPLAFWSRPTPGLPSHHPTVIVDLAKSEHLRGENRRLLDAERHALEEIAAKDRFIATLSHELRTPLTPVLAAVSALHARTDVPAALRPICEMIDRNVRIEARLIDDLLDATRIARDKVRLERRPIDIHEIVLEVIETVRAEIEEKNLEVAIELAAGHHVANADPMRMKQVFWNLLRNAVRFTSRGGHIHFRSWNKGPGPSPRLVVEVADDGQGFDPAAAESLFEPFEQGTGLPARSGGLGLGLAIGKGLIELHGGQISGASRGAGLGARFVVEIDTVAELPAVSPEPAEEPAQLLEKPRILVVDDHPDTAESLRDLLEDVGYDVRIAYSAEGALDANLDWVDVLVSDIGLPKVSGLDLMRHLREHGGIRGIALSGYGTEADVRASQEAGFAVHLTKPVDFNRLLAAIREVGPRG